MSDDELNGWDPKADDFNDSDFNSYNMSSRNKKDKVQLFVEGIPVEVTNDGLRNIFLVAGDVLDAKVVNVKKPDAKYTYGFVTMKTLSQAKNAIHRVDGFYIKGHHLRVKIAMTDDEKKSKRQEEQFLSSLGENHLNNNNNNNNNYQSSERDSLENDLLESLPKLTSMKTKGGVAQEDATDCGVQSGANAHRNSPRDDGYESEKFGSGRGILQGQVLSTERKRPLLQCPEPASLQYGGGYGRGYLPYHDPVPPQFAAAYGRGMPSFWPHPYSGPPGPFGYGPPIPFRPGMGRGYPPYPHDFYDYRPYGGYAEERQSRDGGFNRTLITPAVRASDKMKQKLLCIACTQPASKKCSRCKLPYCSSACQRNHFLEHRETCNQLYLMATSACDDDDLDSQFDVSVNREDVTNFQRSLDELVTDISDTESLIGKIPRKKKGRSKQEGNLNNSKGNRSKQEGNLNNSNVQKNLARPTSKASVDSKIKQDKQSQEMTNKMEQVKLTDSHRFREEDVGSTILPLSVRNKVWVSHVDSPSEVWIQVVSDDLQMLLSSIANPMQNFETSETFHESPRTGDLCLAKAASEKWYRSSVVALKSSNMVQIRYLDFGNMCTTTISNLRPLPEDMLIPTAQAIRCCIAGIVPLIGTVWNDKAKNITSSIVRTDTSYEMEAIEKHGDLYLVNLYDTNTDSNVIHRLISAKVASKVSAHNKVMANEMKSLVDELTTEQELNLYFIDCKSPADFIAQIFQEERLKKFQQMLKDIEEELADCKPTTPYRPQIGEMVFGHYTEGENAAFWTRAEVIAVTNKMATVRYIDYGNKEQLEFSRIIQLNNKFASLPGQAIECFLYVSHQPKQWTEENITEFKKQIGFGTEMAHRSCVVKVKSKGRVGLEIFNSSSQSLSNMFSASKPQSPMKLTEVPQSSMKPNKVPQSSMKPNKVPQSSMKPNKVPQSSLKPNKVPQSSLKPNKVRQSPLKSSEVRHSPMKSSEVRHSPMKSSEVSQIPNSSPSPRIMADVLQSVTLPVDGTPVSATVVDFIAFNDFSIQLTSESAVQVIKHLMLNIAAYVETAENHPGPCLGELVCAKFTDGLWYRCKVKQVQDDHCLLLFVDFGNEDKVAKSLIKVIDKSFLAIPIQSVKGKLAGAVKTSDTDVRSFASQVMNCENKYTVLSHDNSIYEVEIFLSDGQCLNDKFRASPGAPASTNPSTPDMSAPVQPALTISAIKPVLHEFLPAAISFVTDPGNFCCNLLREFQDLSNITSSMAQYCEKNISVERFNPQVGDFCFGKFLDVFYRARIEKKLPGGRFELQYVDYGNVESVTLEDIRPMVKEFANIPSLAIKCSLHGIHPNVDAWSEEATKLLRDFMGKLMLLKVENVVDGCCYVNLMENETNVGQMLVNKGLAVLKTDGNSAASSMTSSPKSDSIPSMSANLHIGQKFKVLISDYSPPSQLILLIVDEKILEERNEFQAGLDQAVKKMPAASFSPQVGDFVLGLFSEDGQWYRAKVEAVSGSQIHVFYVDFGNKEQIDVASIRPLPTEWSRQPAFILSGSIDGVRLPDNEVLSKEKEEVCRHALSKIIISDEMPLAEAEIKSLNGDLITLDLCKDELLLSTELVSLLSPKPTVVMADSLCSAELPIDGSLTDCEFIHVEDLSNFFVRKDDVGCREALEHLMLDLNSNCERNKESHTPIIGEVVAVQFSVDKTWNRGLVYKVTAQSCNVNFIDFGNNEETMFSAIRPLDPKFSKLPIQAIPCSLSGTTDDILISDKEKFINLVAAKKVKVKVVPSDSHLQYAVNVFLPDGSSVSDLLNQSHATKHITAESLVYHHPKERDFQVVIQEVISPSQFYCTELDMKAMEVQTALYESLTQYCSQESTPKCTNLKVGDLCCGLFDGEWFRGEVKEVLPGNRVRLFYVDYGNTNEVDISETRVILKEHTQAEVMAVHCRLSDVHPVGENWDSQAIDFLSKRKEKLLNASVISVKNDEYTIRLINPENGSDVAKELVMDGLALDDAMIKQQIEALHAKLGIR